ncbi:MULTISPECIES: D-2-hydroxyacid dehydrogenase [unclassified Halomonas]|uniref:D-2-hydroxyacid dehydrogenase n=1 Tax=unclassified Halomonas TaxID=2609666 RepID=UPI002888CA64|nr:MULTISPECIES: D-2-hydroxyacid dehydrogenase [unclassified Halomonas]MDT0499787.1 D-2-hydroxyacid dehydrogenase [Halomonas sp. PAR7]MDT0510396.1 D-2-hydroxyacid dehydrogenase [Halomonas sp. LES1]MDT0589895.1 D-2-hydroxyacid dehydrogenase [Halomonas sp. PAR8]
MKAVLLDAASLGPDIDLAPLHEQVDELVVHQRSTTHEAQTRLADAEVAIVNKVVLDATTIEALPSLKLICVLATGTNNIDMATARRLGIEVRNVTGYGTASVAQHTLMMLLTLANRLPLYGRDVTAGRWNESPFFCLMDHRTLQLEGKHLAIVGQGELGGRVAQLAEALGMRVTFTARPGNEAQDQRPGLAELAPEVDAISLHCPLNEATHHLVGGDLLARVKPGALLINCARGGIIDEVAALTALREGRLGGLAVDVLPEEPPRDGHPLLDALNEPLNLIVTPHNAWITPEARQNVVTLTANNLSDWKRGQ